MSVTDWSQVLDQIIENYPSYIDIVTLANYDYRNDKRVITRIGNFTPLYEVAVDSLGHNPRGSDIIRIEAMLLALISFKQSKLTI